MTIAVVADPQYGPGRCASCGLPIVWALLDPDQPFACQPTAVDPQPVKGGELELYAEYFPGGEPVDPGVQRVRRRPADRPASSPAWRAHWRTCLERRRPVVVPFEVLEFVANAALRKWGPRAGGSQS